MTPIVSRQNICLNNKAAHYFSLESKGGFSQPIHMYHANAYPFGTYRCFLEEVQGHVFGLAHRGTWDGAGLPGKDMHWHHYADDLIAFLDQKNTGPVVGIGHSLGAVATTFAAARRPDLFSALVLIDPVFIPTSVWLAFRGGQKITSRVNPMAVIADRRPNQWQSREEAMAFHQPKKAFAAFTPQAMSDFGEFGIAENDDGFGLAYPREWEAHNYRNIPYVWPAIKALKMPVLGIRGETSDVLHPLVMKKWKWLQPNHQLIELKDAGHMVPQESPGDCSEVINRFLRIL
ncbi:alpha/beta fold hydrolase [Sansalvadorimonas verongulae]|uniref:alpha/beta fold hydrolase n=1 Tax=Sansalvadorimonas verongulae TaxID=2172824 RepID=UPI0018AD1D3E|nr:alpha/beta hydrolase [Sansalvadorimonas verongulae]